MSANAPATAGATFRSATSGENVVLPAVPPAPPVVTAGLLRSIAKLLSSNQPTCPASVEPPLSPSIARKYLVAGKLAGPLPGVGAGRLLGSSILRLRPTSQPKLDPGAAVPSAFCVCVSRPSR